MSNEELESIIKRIQERKPYVDIYYKLFERKPQWIVEKNIDKSKYKEELVDFEEWLIWYKREERINEILGDDK